MLYSSEQLAYIGSGTAACRQVPPVETKMGMSPFIPLSDLDSRFSEC